MAIEDIFTLERFQERSRREALGKGIYSGKGGKRTGTVSADVLESDVYKKAVTENYYAQLAKLKQIAGAKGGSFSTNLTSMEIVTRPFFSQSQYQSLLGAAADRKASEEFASTVLSARKKTPSGRASTILGNPQTFLGTNMQNIGG